MRNSYKYTKMYSGGEPIFTEADVFTTVIPLSEAATVTVGPTTQGTTQATQDTAHALQNTTQDRGEESNLTKEDIAILRILAEHPKFTQREIADILHWKLDRVKYYTTKLKKNHVMERIGTSQKGCWKILVEDKIWQN